MRKLVVLALLGIGSCLGCSAASSTGGHSLATGTGENPVSSRAAPGGHNPGASAPGGHETDIGGGERSNMTTPGTGTATNLPRPGTSAADRTGLQPSAGTQTSDKANAATGAPGSDQGRLGKEGPNKSP